MKEKKSIALISSDKIGKHMAGPGIRYFEFAKSFSRFFDVTLIVPDKCDVDPVGFKIKMYDSKHSSSSIAGLVDGFDFVMSQFLRPTALRAIKKKHIRYIADLYDPQSIEVLEQAKYDSAKQQKNLSDFLYYSQALQMWAADLILCSSERQKDLYIGMMLGQRILQPEIYHQSPDLNKLLTTAPFGLSNANPKKATTNVIVEAFPQICAKDKVIFWGGGIWNWFDPLTAIKAVEEIAKERKDVKMVFLGVKHPNPKIDKMKIVEQVLDYCREKDLLDKYIFFNFGWTPYEERAGWLLNSSIGISTHMDNLETRFSFRTRILDYLWAELPIIATEGDCMADLIERKEIGEVVPYNNVEAVKKSILEVIDNPAKNELIKKNIREVKKDFYWDLIVEKICKTFEKDGLVEKKNSWFSFMKLSYCFYLSGFRKKFHYGK